MADVQKSASYAAADSAPAESGERLARKVSQEVRLRLRRFQHEEPLSAKWLELVEPIKFVASVAEQEALGTAAYQKDKAEAPVPGAASKPSTAGVGTSAGTTTVWEQDRVAVRVIVEEGKINLLARGLREFKEAVYALPGSRAPEEIEAAARSYELSLGYILRAALHAVECVQTLNLTSLFEHCLNMMAKSLEDGCKLTPADIGVQELMAVHYLRLVARQLERLSNIDRVIDNITELRLLPMAIRHLERHRTIVDDDLIEAYLFFFAHMADTETFKSRVAEYFPDKAAKSSFALLVDPLAKAHIAKKPDDKRSLRPVTDLVLRWK